MYENPRATLKARITVEEVPNSRMIAERTSSRHGHGTVLMQDHVRGLLGDQIDR